MTEPRPVLDQINFVVRDMDASLAFYRRLGIDIPDRSPEWDPHHRSADVSEGMDLDLDSIAFAREWDAGWTGARGRAERAGLRGRLQAASVREEVDRVYAALTGAGYRGQQEPNDAFWGARYAVVEDPDGNAVGLMSPIDASRRRDTTPPAG